MVGPPLPESVGGLIWINLRRILGSSCASLLAKKIIHDYFDDKIDIESAIMEQPSTFEKALINLIGPLGEKFLADTCENIWEDLGFEDSARYTKIGDLERFVKLTCGSHEGKAM